MKKNIYKIIVGVFSLVLVLVAQNAFASAFSRGSVVWNGHPNDCKGISIVNSTTNEGYGDPCWPATSITADKGDTINVRIFYHNTGSATADNVKVSLSAPVGGSASSTKTFSASISSDQGGKSLGSVTANLSSSQILTFNSVKWYTENTNVTLTPLLNGQSGSKILSGGLDIGSIAPIGATQGSLVVSFHVSNSTTPEIQECKISSFNATETTINEGGSTKLSWVTSNCNSIYISGLGDFGATGNKTISPFVTTTYNLTAYGDNNEASRSLKINVNKIITENMSGSISASPSSCVIPAGASTCPSTLSWNTINPIGTSAITNQGSTVASGNNGTRTVSVSFGSSTYYLYNSSQLLNSTSVSASCASGSVWTGSYCKENTINNDQCTISSFRATPSSIERGESSILSWATNNCTNIVITGMGTYGTPFSGSEIVWPSATKTYTITAYGPTGGTQVKTTTVYVGENSSSQCRIDSFTVTNKNIEKGERTELRWRTTGCDRVKISDIGNVDKQGEETVRPNEDTTYTITAYDKSGNSIKNTLKVYVDKDNNSGQCKIDDFTISNSYINKGDTVKLKWNTTDCDGVTITNLGSVSDDGDKYVYPLATTTYTLRAYGSNNSVSKSVKINVGTDYIDNQYNTNVITTVATNISQTSASLNGLLTSSNSNSQNVYFVYGTTVNLGHKTQGRTVSGNSNFSDYLTNLNPNTIYFFQAVSENANGISRGAIEVFRTLAYANTNTNTNTTNTTNRTTIVQGNTVYGSSSPLMLEIQNRYQTLNTGDIVDYTVYYKNISRSVLYNPMVQVYIPKGITVTNFSAGTYSEDNRTLSVPIQDLKPEEEGIIYIQARVGTVDSNLAQIVTTAILVYTNPNGAQENAMAYVLNNPGNRLNSQGASAFFGGLLGLSLVGWLIVIILILLIVLITRSYFNKQPDHTTVVLPSK